MTRFANCEWCGYPSRGDVLCRTCERREIWTIKGENKRYVLDTVKEAKQEERGVLPEGTETPRIPIRAAVGVMGAVRRVRRGRNAVDCMRIVRENHPTIRRIVRWPGAEDMQ